MFQTPTATANRTAPARPVFRLAGKQVTQEMFYAAQQAKRAGRRCLLVTAGESDISKFTKSEEDCPNCGGFKYLALEVLVAGPLKELPATKQGSADEQPAVHLRPAWHNGAWWSVVRDLHRCPVCNPGREIVL